MISDARALALTMLVVVSVDPRTDRDLLRTASYGTGDLLADRQQIYRFVEPRREPVTEWLFAQVGGPASLPEPIVDVGAGNGQYLFALPGRTTMGLDLSHGMLTGMRAEGFAGPLVEADAQALPLRTGAAGTAMANHMLYHVPDIDRAIDELRRVVRPDGVVLVVTNGLDHLAELGKVIDDAVMSTSGAPFHFDRSGERFDLDGSEDRLRRVFGSVTRDDRRATLVVPGAEPVMRYLSSLAGLATMLPESVPFEAMLAVAAQQVDAIIERDGVFRAGLHAGAFVCR